MEKKEVKLTRLEEGLLQAMCAIDSQVSREMQRSPSDLEKHGVQKWEAYSSRVELLCSFVLDTMADKLTEIDSVIVLAQAFSKVLYIISEDLGEEGLGKLRAQYCLDAAKKISYDSQRIVDNLKTTSIS